MPKDHISERHMAALAAGVAAATGLGMVGAIPAQACQGNMERAPSALCDGLAPSREATPNKGGHRERATHLLQQAIAETQAGVAFADELGGGGAQ